MPRLYHPRNPGVLERYDIDEMVEAIQELLWLDGETWNAEKTIDALEVLLDIRELLECRDLKPKLKETD